VVESGEWIVFEGLGVVGLGKNDDKGYGQWAARWVFYRLVGS
jgi:hypothetical protein